ncbi:hypothetical protein HG531_002938 [Fusarium graminearum]|nr:hypothetical protein HG531_002938 [Fusarium graminearum]
MCSSSAPLFLNALKSRPALDIIPRCLLEEGVDRKVEVVDRGVQRGLESVAVEIIKRCGLLDGTLDGSGGDLVKERCEEVRVVDADRDLGEDVLEGQVALGTLAGIVNEGDGVLVGALVVELVLDKVHIDKVAHGGTCVPTDVVGIDVDLLEVSDHLILVGNVLLLSGGSSGELRSIALVAIGCSGVDGREREGVGDFKETFTLHSNNSSGRNRRESRRAVLGDLHNNL